MHSIDTCGPTQAAKCVDDHVARRPSWLAVLFSTAPGCRTRPESDCGQRSSTSTSIRARNRFGGRSADLRSLARTPLAAYGTSLADDLATYRSHIAYTQLRPPLRPRPLSAFTPTTTHLSSPRLSTDTTKRAMRKLHDARVPTYSLRARLYRLSRAHTRMPRCTVRRYGPTASIQHPGKIHHPKYPNGRAQHGLERQPSSVHSRPPCLASRRVYPPFRDVLAFSALARTLSPPMPIYTPILHAYPAHISPSLSGRAPRARPFHARARADPAIAAENRVERRNGACDAWSTLHASQTHTLSRRGSLLTIHDARSVSVSENPRSRVLQRGTSPGTPRAGASGVGVVRIHTRSAQDGYCDCYDVSVSASRDSESTSTRRRRSCPNTEEGRRLVEPPPSLPWPSGLRLAPVLPTAGPGSPGPDCARLTLAFETLADSPDRRLAHDAMMQ